MINILVTLTVKDFSLLAEFERQAVKVMKSHGGELLRAFESHRNDDGSGEEIHLLEFPSQQAFDAYRADPALDKYAELRNKAISQTQVVVSSTLKMYE